MHRQSPSRTHRSKGIKIKHVLQICLLLAVCFWLIYQVKHSHDKKKEFDESDLKSSLSRGSSNEILTLGRKDIRPRVEESVGKSEKHDEAAIEQESIEEEVEDDKHEEDEQEIKKAEQREDEGMEGGDDEINEQEQEKSDAEKEIDREEEFIDEEKEGDEGVNSTVEKDSEKNNGEAEKEGSMEDSDHDGDEHSAHEAREEHYMADDASSAVAHDNPIDDPENENRVIENTKERQTNILERENKENGEEINLGDKRTDLEVRDDDLAKSDNQSNVITNLEWKNKENSGEINLGDKITNLEVKDGNISKSDNQSNVTTDEAEENLKEKSENSSLSNATLTEGSNDHIETSNNSLEVSMESRDPSLQNGIESKLELNHGENGTTGGTTSEEANNSTSDMESNHVDSNSTIPLKNKDLESSSGEFSDSSESSVAKNIRLELTVEAGNNTESLTVKNDATEAERSDTDSSRDEFTDKTSEEVQHDPIDSSDSSNSLDEKDVLTNHEALPEIQTAGTSIEDAAAE